MKNRRLIKETANPSQMYTDPILEVAVRQGCFPTDIQGPITDTVTNKEAVYRYATTEPLRSTSPHIFFFSDGSKSYRAKKDGPDVIFKEKGWWCEDLAPIVDPSRSPVGEEVVTVLRGNPYYYKLWSEVKGSATREYEQVDLKNPQNLPDNMQTPQYTNAFKNASFIMWRPRGVEATVENTNDAAKRCIADYKARGYEDTPAPNFSTVQKIDIAKLGQCGGGAKFVNNTYPMWRDTSGLGTTELKQGLKDWSEAKVTKDTEKSWCRTGIQLFHQAYDDRTIIDQSVIDDYKYKVLDCTRRYNFPMLKNKIDELQWAKPFTSTGTGQKLRYGLKESKEQSGLKKVIRENLILISDNNKKRVIQEQKIVRNRFKFLFENSNLKTKKGQKLLAKQLFFETAYLNTQGFDKKIINEGFFEILKGLFGNSIDSVFQYFKEYAIQWLMEKFGVDSSGWIGSIIITTIGNLDLADIPKLTDCNFVTKLLSKSLAEGTLRKLQTSTVGLGPVQDIIRNTLVEIISETEFGEKLESALGSLLCPLISSLAGKLGMAGDQLKSQAMGETPNKPSGSGGFLDKLTGGISGLFGGDDSKNLSTAVD